MQRSFFDGVALAVNLPTLWIAVLPPRRLHEASCISSKYNSWLHSHSVHFLVIARQIKKTPSNNSNPTSASLAGFKSPEAALARESKILDARLCPN